MGQYHYLVNLTKKQFVNPHNIGNGLKLHEQIGFDCSTATALTMLLACSNGRGGGDFQSKSPLMGSWAGDKIAFIGDYTEKGDIKGVNTVNIYKACSANAKGFRDISLEVCKMMSQEFGVRYTGTGWKDIVEDSNNSWVKSKCTPDLVMFANSPN